MFLARFETDNFFTLFDTHFLSAYSNKSLTKAVINRKGAGSLHLFPQREHLALQQPNFWDPLFQHDRDIYVVSWAHATDLSKDGFANSLFAARLLEISHNRRLRRGYDEYFAFVNVEFGRLMGMLEQSGQLDNTIVILTSGHGEMFERGI